MFVAINDELPFDTYECGMRAVFFGSKPEAREWAARQPDFGDWIILPLEMNAKVGHG